MDLYEKLLSEIVEGSKLEPEQEGADIGDVFDEFIISSVEYGIKDGKKISHFPCDTCRRKSAIIEKYKKLCIKEYVPPYIDKECRDLKMSLIIEKIDEELLIKAFDYFILKTSFKDILELVKFDEWKMLVEEKLCSNGLKKIICENFGVFTKELILEILFDINYCFFNDNSCKKVNDNECIKMIKYYIVMAIREKMKTGIVKFAEILELELEYKIAVVESEIRYYIKCILQEIVITPVPATNYNINFFNKIGSLTEILSIEDGIGGGKHDQRGDFKHIRDTIRKYEKVVKTTFDALNERIQLYNKLIKERKFIVGVTGICEKESFRHEREPIVPPTPCIILNPPEKKNKT